MPKMRYVKIFIIGIGLIAAGIWSRPGQTVMVAPTTVSEMITMAAQIFEGKVLETSVEFDECNHVVTYTIFKVLDTIKGAEVGDTVVLAQLGTSKPVPDGVKAYRKTGPSFEQDKTYVVFLDREVEPKPGACSYNNPVGLDAGAFMEEVNKDGSITLRNGLNNRNLFDSGSASKLAGKTMLSGPEERVLKHKSGPVEKEGFISIIKKMAGSGQ